MTVKPTTWASAASRSTRRYGTSPPTTSGGRRRAGPVYDESHRLDGRVSHRGRPPAGPRDREDHRRGKRAVVDGRPAQHATSRSRRPRRACPAITATIAEGISVNVTLIFSLERYSAVMDAYLERPGEGRARPATTCARSPRSPRSSSSRVDTEVDKRLDKIGTDEAKALKGKAGHRQRPAGLRAVRAADRHRPVAGAGGQGRPGAAAAVGVHQRQGPRRSRTPCTWSSWWPRTR